MIGTIKNLPTGKDYGFIATSIIGDVFFHASELTDNLSIDDLRIGDSVDFTPVSSDKGYVAQQVKIAITTNG